MLVTFISFCCHFFTFLFIFSLMAACNRRRLSAQWSFTKTINNGTLINLDLAANNPKLRCMTCTAWKKKNVSGCIRLTHCLSPPGLEKTMGQAEFKMASVSNDHLMQIQMKRQHWETGSAENLRSSSFTLKSPNGNKLFTEAFDSMNCLQSF